MKQGRQWNILIVVLLLCCSCVPTFSHPLSTADTVDDHLVGVWKLKDKSDEKEEFVKISKIEKSNQYFISDSDRQGNYIEGKEKFIFHVTKLGNRSFMNVLDDDNKKGTPAKYFIVKYQLKDNNALGLRLPDTDAFEKLITDKKLNGQITPDKFIKSIHITESVAGLQKFFSSEASESLFDDEQTIHRVQ